MADFTALKTAIQNAIKQNGNEEITGNLLQEVLLAIVTTLGDGSINDLVTALGSEATIRGNADSTLQQNIDAEAQARGNADTALGGRIDGVIESINAINTAIGNGYVYAGIATPSSTPTTGKVFYLALTSGTYTNFGNIAVTQGINILKYNGSAWSLDAFIGIDDTPTPSSNNLVKSSGVFNGIMTNGSAFDLTAYNNGTTYADLNAALTALNALPAAYKKGGMSMKYVHTSDNKYVQFRLIATSFSTNEDDWQGVDDEPTAGSENLVKSKRVWQLKNSSLNEISRTYATFSIYSDFIRGGYSGKYYNELDYRVCSDSIISPQRRIKVTIADGFRINICYYNNGVYVSDSGWKTGNVSIESDKEYKLVIARVNEDLSEVADIDSFVKKVTINTATTDKFEEIDGNINEVAKNISVNNNDVKNINDVEYKNLLGYSWKRGQWAGIYYNELSYRVCSDEYITFEDATKLYVNSGFRVNLTYEGGADTGFKSGIIYIASNTKVHITIARQTDNTSETADIDTFVSSIKVYSKYAYTIGNLNWKINENTGKDFSDFSNIFIIGGASATVGQTLTFNSSTARIANRTPICPDRDFIINIKDTDNILLYPIKVQSRDNLTVLEVPSSYSKGGYLKEGCYYIISCKKSNEEAFSAADVESINNDSSLLLNVRSANEMQTALANESIFTYGSYAEVNGVSYNPTSKICIQPFKANNSIFISYKGGSSMRDSITNENGDLIASTGYVTEFCGYLSAGIHHIMFDTSNITDAKNNIKIYTSNYFDILKDSTRNEQLLDVLASKKHYNLTNVANPSLNRSNLLTIAHITDVHSDAVRYASFARFVDNMPIDIALCSGDLVDENSDAHFSLMNSIICRKGIYQVVGNHEELGLDGQNILTPEVVYQKLGMNTNTNLTYYYIDKGSVRIIVLNSFITGDYGFNQTEIDWLINTLQDALNNNLQVIIASHLPDTVPVYNNRGFYVRNTSIRGIASPMNAGIEALINAFKTGGSINSTYQGLTINTEFESQGTFIAYICGHWHADMFGYSETYPDQLYLMPTCGACRASIGRTTLEFGEEWNDTPRIMGTPSEDSFNTYTIDTDKKQIKVVRIGSNVNDEFDKRDKIIFNY